VTSRSEENQLERAWAGLDIGKHHHHAVVVGADGEKLHSQRVANDEPALLALIARIEALADEVIWAIDLRSNESVLLVTLLLAHGEQIVYVPGMTVNRAAGSYRGAGKTDAKDAYIIADQARMRRDLTAVRPDPELIVELQMLVAQRRDLAADRTRAVNRLHDRLLAICPALERVLDLGNRGPLVLLTGYQTPAALCEAGGEGVTAWLQDRRVRGAAMLAASALRVAQTQITAAVDVRNDRGSGSSP
jgi:transposase